MTYREHHLHEIVRKLLSSKETLICSIVLLYATMFCLNYFTYYTDDDYSYMYSLLDGSRITNIYNIIQSLYVHAFTKNGRLIAHFFTYFFLMLPPVCFDIVNAAMFTTLIVILYYYAKPEPGKHNTLLFWIIFAFVCCFTSAFGEVYLWLDGSCNYLWGVVNMLIYLSPFLRLLRHGMVKFKSGGMIFFVIYSFVIGAWQETASFGMIFFAATTIIVYHFVYKESVKTWMILSVVASFCGWLVMILSPGTLLNKTAELSVNTYISNFVSVLTKYKNEQWLPLLIFFFLFAGNLYFKYEKKNILCSAVCFASSLLTNFMHIAASYYASRSMIASTIFLVLAICFLLKNWLNGSFEKYILSFGLIFGLYTACELANGSKDIIKTYYQCMQREDVIREEIAQCNYDIELSLIISETKYSSKYALKDLDTLDVTKNPNYSMAKYYGVESILGVLNED